MGGVPVPQSIEAGSQDWDMTCGACHPGGGQMEYDRNQNAYSSSSPAGDYYRYQLPSRAGAGGVVPGWLSSTNKAEIDCLLCHLHDNSNISGNGLAALQSEGCGAGNPIGPKNDPTCATVPDDSAPFSIYGLTGAKWNPVWAGAKYDHYNRNIAIKAKQYQYAASLGLGAIATGYAIDANGEPTITGVSGMPTIIPAANIQGTPNSQNCSVCHARDDNTPGLVGMFHMRKGYGGYELIIGQGTGYDSENPAGTYNGKTNTERWLELGCKTGMGKRGHRIGAGPNDKWNNSMVRTMYGLDTAYPAGTLIPSSGGTNVSSPGGDGTQFPNSLPPIAITSGPFAGGKITQQARIPDQDVHDAGGLQCASCHYTLGSKALGIGVTGTQTIPATTYTDVLPLSSGTIAFPSKTYKGIDHQFAKMGTMEDTNSMPNINGTVSCESCHIDRTHPRYFDATGTPRAGVTPFPPTPAHSFFPAIHLAKISCTTCHIPEVYAAPGRLKYRDYSLGYFKKGSDASGGWRNMLDWNWDFIHWSAKPVPPIHVWATRNGKTQIVPVLPSTIPAWEVANTNTMSELNSDAAVTGKTGACNSTDAAHAGNACSVATQAADCGTGTCIGTSLDLSGNQFFVANPGMGMTPGPVKARDTSIAALAAEATGQLRRGSVGACTNDGASCSASADCTGGGTCTIRKNEINGANLVPLFDGFPLADSWAVDTKPRIDTLYGNGAGQYMRIYQAARFDVTHGVVPKEWALGGINRGGCVSCHSSGDAWQRDDAGNFVKDTAGKPLPNPNYNANSVSFFEGFQQPFQVNEVFPGVTQYDLVKNWFAIFADFDGTKFANGLHMTQGFCYNMCTNTMQDTKANCSQFCPGGATVGAPTSNTAYAALYFCDDGPGGMPIPSTCSTGGHLAPSSHMGDALVGYMPMGQTDNYYYDPVTGMPRTSGVIGLQYQCKSFAMTGADCNGASDPMSCALSGMPAAYGDACTTTVNPNWNKPIRPNGRIYANFIMPCWDAQTNPTCAGTTMPNANYKSEAYDPFLAAVTGFMTTSFDLFMFYTPGTAQSLGWWDGTGAIRMLITRETQSGLTNGCDPFAGGAGSAVAKSPKYFNVNLNNCVPNTTTFNGACTPNAGGPGVSLCMGGAMQYQPCTVASDCQGALAGADLTQLTAQGFPSLLYSRAEIRDRFKINLQQSCGGTYNPDGSVNNACTGNEANPLVPGGITYSNARLTWPIGSEANPDNPAHIPAWDEAGKLNVCGKFQNQPCCTNMLGQPETCKDGSYVKTTIHMNQLLGYPKARFATLTSQIAGGASSVNGSPVLPANAGVAVCSKVSLNRTIGNIGDSFQVGDNPPSTINGGLGGKVYIDWGDGSAMETMAMGASTGMHTYSNNGTYKIRKTVQDNDPGIGSSFGISCYKEDQVTVSSLAPTGFGTFTVTANACVGGAAIANVNVYLVGSASPLNHLSFHGVTGATGTVSIPAVTGTMPSGSYNMTAFGPAGLVCYTDSLCTTLVNNLSTHETVPGTATVYCK